MTAYKATITSEDGTEDGVRVHLDETRDKMGRPSWRGSFDLGRRIPVAGGPQFTPCRLKLDDGRSGDIHIMSAGRETPTGGALFLHVFTGRGPLE